MPADNWKITQGDILDPSFVSRAGKFDVVYSWGVIHHTGNMWKGLGNIAASVRQGGLLFIAIYNEQGWKSRFWKIIKCAYVFSPRPIKFLLAAGWYSVVIFTRTTGGLLKLKPVSTWYTGSERGMSLWYDAVDWIGGYPFETASAMQLFDFYIQQGFGLRGLKLKFGMGCNELVFRLDSDRQGRGNPGQT